jgi:hypothetical protein
MSTLETKGTNDMEIFMIAACVYASASALEPERCSLTDGRYARVFHSAAACEAARTNGGYHEYGLAKFRCLAKTVPTWQVVR